MTPALTYTVKAKDKVFTFVHWKKYFNYGDSFFRIALNIKSIINNGESRFLRLFDKLKIVKYNEDDDDAYKFLETSDLSYYSYMMAYEYDLMTLLRNGYVFTYEIDPENYGDVHIEVDFNKREIREIVSWLLVARKIYSFDNIQEAVKSGEEVY